MDAAVMEASLVAVREAGVDIVPALFERFFAEFPEERPRFHNLVAAQGRMTNETIEAMTGLAADAPWVKTTVVNFVDLHKDYGEIRYALYAAFIDMAVDALGAAAGEAWTAEAEAAWRHAAERLKAMVHAAM